MRLHKHTFASDGAVSDTEVEFDDWNSIHMIFQLATIDGGLLYEKVVLTETGGTVITYTRAEQRCVCGEIVLSPGVDEVMVGLVLHWTEGPCYYPDESGE